MKGVHKGAIASSEFHAVDYRFTAKNEGVRYIKFICVNKRKYLKFCVSVKFFEIYREKKNMITSREYFLFSRKRL